MTGKTVLIAGATGLVGYAAMRHFSSEPGTKVIAVSRRKPDTTFSAEHMALDLMNAGQCADALAKRRDITHVVFAALYEASSLVAGWQEAEQIAINERLLRNLMEPILSAAPDLQHVSLLQGTKAYGVHVRPMKPPAREDRDEARDIPNFYWNQEGYLRERQRGRSWAFTILRPVLIVGEAIGGAMSLIPPLGAYAALRGADGHKDLPYPGGAPRLSQAVDADLLARAIAWGGASPNARNQAFNITNGDVMLWPYIWPAIARTLGMEGGGRAPLSLIDKISPRQADWATLVQRHALKAPGLKEFVGLSFQYADYQMGYGRPEPGPPSFVSTIKIQQAGFTEVMDTEAMFAKWFRIYQDKRLLPQPGPA